MTLSCKCLLFTTDLTPCCIMHQSLTIYCIVQRRVFEKHEYLCKFEEQFENILVGASGAEMKSIEGKNWQ